MAVVVVGSDADQPDRSAERCVQRRRLVARTVMRDLDQIDGRGVRAREQPRLGLLAEIAEQDRAQASRAALPHRPQLEHEARVVAGVDAARRRPDHLPGELAQHPTRAALRRLDARPVRAQSLADRRVGGIRGDPQQGPIHPPEHGVEAAHVVGVEVGEHQKVDARDTEFVEARRERLRLAADIDERDLPGAANQRRVALPDIAGGVLPRARSAQRVAHPARQQREGVGEQCEGEQPCRDPADRRCAAPGRQDQQRRRQRDGGEQHHPADPVEPGAARDRKRGGGLRHRRDPAGREPRQADERLGEPRRDREEQAGHQAQHGRHRRRRCGEHVGRNTVDRERGVEQQQDRLARELGRRRDGDHESERTRQHPRQPLGQRPGEHEQPRGREHREREPVVAGEPRVYRQQREDAQAQQRHAAGRAPERQPEQRGTGHDARPQHARLGRDEHHEAEQRDERAAYAHRPRGPQHAAQSEDEGHHDGAVRPRDGGEMTE